MDPELASLSDQPVGASSYPQKNLTKNILTPKDTGRFILECLTNGSHQMDLRILYSLCFVSFV